MRASAAIKRGMAVVAAAGVPATVSVAALSARPAAPKTAGASAPSITVNHPCYTEQTPNQGRQPRIVVKGSGFTPGATITLFGVQTSDTTSDDAISATATASAAGRFTTRVPAPDLGTIRTTGMLQPVGATDTTPTTDDYEPWLLAAQQAPGGPAPVVTTTFNVASFSFATDPYSGTRNQIVTWTFSGFHGGATVYGHFKHGSAAAQTHRFGTSRGPCHVLAVPARRVPVSPNSGTGWSVQIDTHRAYSASTRPRITAQLSGF